MQNPDESVPNAAAAKQLRADTGRRLAVMGDGAPRLVEAVVGGFDGTLTEPTDGDVPEADALLIAADLVLYGLPGGLKARLDEWARAAPRGAVIPRTSRMRVGYVAVHAPNDPDMLAIAHRQLRATFSFFGMSYRGRAAGHVPEGGQPPESLVATAKRLGAVLAGEPGYAGPPAGLLDGIAEFNRGEFWNAHEAWEDVWLEAEPGTRFFFQGLIQVAAALHHAGHQNWGGLGSLMLEGIAKLELFRPGLLGVDLEDLLEKLEPWRIFAKARAGDPDPVTRLPEGLPNIAVHDA